MKDRQPTSIRGAILAGGRLLVCRASQSCLDAEVRVALRLSPAGTVGVEGAGRRADGLYVR